MPLFIIASSSTRQRALFDTAAPLDDRLAEFSQLLEAIGASPLSTTHQVSAVAGPDHAHNEVALAAYGLETMQPCHPKIVQQAIEMLVAAELLPTAALDDTFLSGVISLSFAEEHDWDHRSAAAEVTMRAYLQNCLPGFDVDPAEMPVQHIATISALAAGLAVAITKARADWSY